LAPAAGAKTGVKAHHYLAGSSDNSKGGIITHRPQDKGCGPPAAF